MMTNNSQRRAFCLGAAAHLSLALFGAKAFGKEQPYPSRPITLIVPWPAGGATDMVARLLAERLQGLLGQTVLVENRPGATGYIGSQAVLRAPADGYTLLMMAASVHSFSPAVMRSMPFDPIKDFQPISQTVEFPYVMIVPADSPYRSVDDLLRDAGSKPEGLSYGSIGNGSASHLISELLALRSGATLLHIPYKGGAQALQDLLGGRYDFLIDSLPSPLAHIQSGRLRALAVTSQQRMAQIPDVPSLSETLPEFEAISWLGIGCAPGVPPRIVTQLDAALRQVASTPGYMERINAIGATPVSSASPQAFSQFLENEREKWQRVALDAKIPLVN